MNLLHVYDDVSWGDVCVVRRGRLRWIGYDFSVLDMDWIWFYTSDRFCIGFEYVLRELNMVGLLVNMFSL